MLCIFHHQILKESVYIYELDWLQDKEKMIKENMHLDEMLFNDRSRDPYKESYVIGFICEIYDLEFTIDLMYPKLQINEVESEPKPNENKEENKPIPQVNEDDDRVAFSSESDLINFLPKAFKIEYNQTHFRILVNLKRLSSLFLYLISKIMLYYLIT
jgi:hypothetical protein